MTALLLAVLPIVLGALFAGQVAVTRTGRLRKDILANLDLLGRLPAEHPNRAELETRTGELVSVLARRQRRRYGPFTEPGVSFGVLAALVGVGLVLAGFEALIAAGVIPADPNPGPPTSREQWAAVWSILAMAAGLTVLAFRVARRQLREHPPPVQQPTEAG